MQGNKVQSDIEQQYDHVPKLVETGHEGTVTIVWDQQVQSDTTIADNKPNILIRDHEKGTRLLFDMTCEETEMWSVKKLGRSSNRKTLQ